MAELKLRASAITAIKRIRDRVASLQPGVYDEFQLEQELKSLSSHFTRFTTNHDHLVGTAENSEVQAHDQLWQEIEDIYNTACTMLNRALMGKKSHVITTPKWNNENEVKLERLAVPTFDGTFQNWLAFKDAFEVLVHNTEYPEAYKIGKLRQAVSASAVPLVGSVYSGGYAELWQALTERFDNKQLLAETHVSRLLNIKPALDDSSRALLAIVDSVHESVRALRVMGLPVSNWDAIVVPVVVSKLPQITQREWNMECSPTEIPKLEELISFLSQRAHSLSTALATWNNGADAGPRSKNRGNAQCAVKSHVATSGEARCACCTGMHRITKCPRLLAMNHGDRRQ